MAIIKCPECGKEVSDKATSCPNCGCPIAPEKNVSVQNDNFGLKCPKCLSSKVVINQKGFSGGKALAGAVAVGSLGLLAGTIGNNDLICNCVDCGFKFEPKHAVKEDDTAFWNKIDSYLKKGNLDGACSYYCAEKGMKGVDEANAQVILEERLKRINPNAKEIIRNKYIRDIIFCVFGIAIFIIVAIMTISK